MKILAITSTVDLKFKYGCTLQWWQLFKGMYEIGVDLVVAPYLGYDIKSPWWSIYRNPCQIEGHLYVLAKTIGDKFVSPRQDVVLKETFKDRLVRDLTRIFIQPKWRRHIDYIFHHEEGIDAVIVVGVPLNQFTNIPTYIKSKYRLPILYYDGDVPSSLPKFGGYASGFRRYDGADLSEYDALISNSKAGMEELKKMGAKRVECVYYGADPELFSPLDVEQDIDVFFYGFGWEYRKKWIECMVTYPSKILANLRFVIRGSKADFNNIDIGNAKIMQNVSLNRLRELTCRSKINLNITRDNFAKVYASSSARLFELASTGCCIVSNPCNGMEEWFEPGKELFVVHNEREAVDTYRRLLFDYKLRKEVGYLARQRVLREHTYRHRAKRLADIIKSVLKRESIRENL